MRVLLTNDDGYASEGLRSLREALLALGAQVTVVAPAGNRSGIAKGITLQEEVQLEQIEDGGAAVFVCSGTPVDCVRIGLLGNLGSAPDVVVSGINHGTNLGDDATYSGTVGAAADAALLGWPALSFAQQTCDGGLRFRDTERPIEFPHGELAARIVFAVGANHPPARSVVNVNFPHGTPTEVVLARPGRRDYASCTLTPRRIEGGVTTFLPYGMPDDPPIPYEKAPDTDFVVLAAGRAPLTVLPVGWQQLDGDVDISTWFERLELAALA
jgi:5'-nucleotidase